MHCDEGGETFCVRGLLRARQWTLSDQAYLASGMGTPF